MTNETRKSEDEMTAEELMALPGYMRPINEILEDAALRIAAIYPRGYAIVEPAKPGGDIVIVLLGHN